MASRGQRLPDSVGLLPRQRGARGAAAVLFIVDPERARQTPLALLEDLYGLTEAEGRLAWHLLQGHSLAKAARSLGISRNTAHAHLASVFRKTGTARQLEAEEPLVG